MEKYILRLIFETPDGKEYQMAIDIGSVVGRDFEDIKPPPKIGATFTQTSRTLRKKSMRGDLFEDEARRLGRKLAEYMEDKEGWHGGRRQDLAIKYSVVSQFHL